VVSPDDLLRTIRDMDATFASSKFLDLPLGLEKNTGVKLLAKSDTEAPLQSNLLTKDDRQGLFQLKLPTREWLG